MVMHGCLRPRGRNNGERLVSTLNLSVESLMPMDSRIPTGRAFPAVLWAGDWGKEGLVMGRSCWAVVGSFATESFQGERKKVQGVHVSP